MTPPLTTFRAQVRHLRVIAVVIDAVTMIAVGMLTMFVLLLASFQNFDSVLFESTLRYDTRTEMSQSPPGDGLSFTVTEGVQLMSARRFDDPTRQRGDLDDSVSPIVWSHADASGDQLSSLLRVSIVTGAAEGTRVLIDEATAVALAVRPGDDLVLITWDGDRCRLNVSGVTRTYREVGGSLRGGLLVVPADTCADGVTTWTEESKRYLQFDSATPAPSAQTWSERMRDVVLGAMDFRVSGLLPAILAIGLGLWCVVSLRAARRIRDSLELPSDLLFDFGCTAARVRTTHLLVSGVLVTVAAVGAAWGAHEALWRVAEFYTQWAHWVSVGLVFAAATMTVLFIAHVRAGREASRRPSPSASTPTSDKGNS